MLGLWLVAGSDPSRSLGTIAVFAVLVGLSSATQDIAIDAWRIEAAEVSRQGAMAAAYQWGYRVAIITAGAVPLLLAEAYSWNFSYAVMAALMTVGILAVLAAPREARHAIRDNPDGRHSTSAGARCARVDCPARRPLGGRARFWAPDSPPMRACSRDVLERHRRERLARRRGRRRGRRTLASGCISERSLAGFCVIVVAALPLPGARTRPGVYLSSALGDPLRDFFARYRASARAHSRVDLPLSHLRTSC